MKVLYILNSSIMGGATISFINMIKGLSAYGVVPVVVLPNHEAKENELTKYFQQHSITYYHKSLIAASFPKPSNILQQIKMYLSGILMYIRRYRSYRELLEVVKKEKPDIIHTNVGVIREGLYVAKKTRTPHVLHIREYQDKDFGWVFVPSRRIFEDFVKRSDAIITITDNLRKYFHLQDITKATTIYNGIYSKTDTLFIKDKQNYFFCASRIVPGKGYEDIIEAFSLFRSKHPNYELIIAGQGEKEYMDNIHDIIERKLCKDSIKLLGHIDNPRPLMSKARALLVASRNEGFGRMTAEACFNGCLVIGRNTGGTKEIIEATCGFLFDSIDTLVKQMEDVCQLSADEYQEMALKAQAKATLLYSTESNTEQTYNIYKQLI